MKTKAITLILVPTACLSLGIPLATAAIGDSAPAETGAKASAPTTPGDAGKSGSAAGMTNGTGSRQGGAAGLGTHGRSDGSGDGPAQR